MRHALVLVRRATYVGLVLLASPPAGSAQVQPIRDTVTVTAAANPVPFENLARAATVLTREQIARLPASSVAELLRLALGVDVHARAPFGIQSDVSIRGASFGQTLVLVDGVRLNDAQSGHHNGDIPVPLEEIERIEILPGAGSSLHGADAFGGTINVITRSGAGGANASVSAGDHGLIQGAARWSADRAGGLTVAAEGARSSGFMFARDFATVTASAALRTDGGTRLRAGLVRRAFGANGFYGPSPSREWTNQALATVARDGVALGPWQANVVASYRTHGDRFLWDSRRPGELESRHRTHAVLGAARLHRDVGPGSRIAIGAETGGDWIRSNNLGDHQFGRAGFYAEWQQALGPRAVLYPGVRYDHYSSFGGAWSPALSGSVWIASAVRLRAAGGRAFRIPTFTELYYRDPVHQASGQLRPEHAWNLEGGLDWFVESGWIASATAFRRSERDVIDWVRPSAAEMWRTTNIHRVRTNGVELEIRRVIGSAGFAGIHYSRLSASAGQVALLSKYVLDYPREALALKTSTDLPGRFSLGQRVAFTRRADGRRYWVADARVSRALHRTRLFVEGTNLFDTEYQEVKGVEMPGRWIRVGIELDY